jgi:hypothetical protein
MSLAIHSKVRIKPKAQPATQVCNNLHAFCGKSIRAICGSLRRRLEAGPTAILFGTARATNETGFAILTGEKTGASPRMN